VVVCRGDNDSLTPPLPSGGTAGHSKPRPTTWEQITTGATFSEGDTNSLHTGSACFRQQAACRAVLLLVGPHARLVRLTTPTTTFEPVGSLGSTPIWFAFPISVSGRGVRRVTKAGVGPVEAGRGGLGG
jgi:hypothetical protein